MKTRTFIFITTLLLLVLAILLVVYFLYVPLVFPNSNKEVDYLTEQVRTLQEENARLKADTKEDSESEDVKNLEVALSIAQQEANKVPKLQKKVKKLSKHNLSSEDKEQLELLYPDMEFDYEIRDSTIKFYSDPSCKEEFLINKDLVWIGWVDHAYPYFNDPKDSSTYSTYFSSKVLDYDNDGKYDYVYSKTSPVLYAIK